MIPVDLLLDIDGDIDIQDGDLVLGDATKQHKALLLVSQPGEWKQSPVTGIGMQDFINDDRLDEAEGVIRKQFEADGMTVRKVDVFEDGSITEDAYYN